MEQQDQEKEKQEKQEKQIVFPPDLPEFQKTAWKVLNKKNNIDQINQRTTLRQTALFNFRVKVYKFSQNRWWEKGIGTCRFSQTQTSNKIRFVAKHDETNRILINHFIVREEPLCILKPLQTMKNTWCWACVDFSTGDPVIQIVAIRTTFDESKRFKESFDKAIDIVNNITEEFKSDERETHLDNLAKKAKEQRTLQRQGHAPPPKQQQQEMPPQFFGFSPFSRI